MALSLALQTALSGLIANQKNISVLSQNLANANTEGYTRKVTGLESQTLAGNPQGVRVTGILRKIDQFLLSTTRMHEGQVASNQAISDYYNRIQAYFGDPNGTNNLQGFVDNFFTALKDLANNPESSSVRGNALNAATGLVDEITSLARSMHEIRYAADQDITRAVSEMNGYIDQLYDLNNAITQSYSSGQVDTDLLDKRDLLMKKMAGIMNINSFEHESGAVNVYAGNGISLVDEVRHRLVYNPATSVNAFIGDASLSALEEYALDASGNVTGQGHPLITGGTEGNITTVLTSGRIYGLQQIRDNNVNEILDRLDEMASVLTEEFNNLHNDGAGFPPPSTLTGSVPITSDTIREWSGSVMIGVVNKDGTAIPTAYTNEYGGVRPLTLRLGDLDVGNGLGRLDMETIKDEINAAFGPNQKKIQIQNLNDVRLVSLGNNTPAGTSFTFDLDLENISDQTANVTILSVTPSAGVVNSFTATTQQVDAGVKKRTGVGAQIDVDFGAAGIRTLDVQIQVVDEDGNTSTATVRYTIDTSITDIRNNRYVGAVQAGATGQVQEKFPTNGLSFATAQIVNEDGNPVAAGQTGYLKITTTNSNYGIAINELDSSENGLTNVSPQIEGTGQGLSKYFGLNDFFVRNDTDSDGTIDRRGSAINMRIRSDIAANASLLSTGRLTLSLQPADPDMYPYYSYELGAGGNQTAEDLANLANVNLTFAAVAGLPLSSKPIADYVSDVVGATSNSTVLADSSLESSKYIRKAFQDKFDAAAGVNIDEEMANTVIFQNAYSASAKIISTVDRLFEALLNVV